MQSPALFLAIAATVVTPALAQSPARLPITEGFWVATAKTCSATQEMHVYKNNRFGPITSYRGSKAAPLERVDRVEASSGGFVRFFSYFNGDRARGEMPSAYEVAARRGGLAVVRASSYATGEVAWSQTSRQCPPETLPASLRAEAQRLGLLQGVAAVNPSPRSRLPLPLGYYNSRNVPCERESDPLALVKLMPGVFANALDGGVTIRAVRQTAPGRYEVLEEVDGNEDGGGSARQTSIYQVLSATSFSYRTLPRRGDGQGAGRPTTYTYCDQSRVPARLKY